jgi:hypothetical protein
MITTKRKEDYNDALTKPSTAIGEGQQHSSRAYYNFVNSFRSLETRKIYEFIIKKYMQFHNLQTVDELLSLAIINKDNTVVIEDNRLACIIA